MSSPKMNSLAILARKAQIFSGPPQCQTQGNFLQDGQGFPVYRLQLETLVQLSFEPSGGDVWPRHSYVRPGVHGHKARSVTDPAMCDQVRVGLFCNDRQRVMERP
jgi:hypothetical protein